VRLTEAEHGPLTTTFYCLRHAESEDNEARVYASAPPGRGLTERGRRQATGVRDLLAGRRLTAVYTSTAARAEQTGAIIADGGPPVHAIPDLLEYGIGELEDTAIPAADDASLAVLRAWIVEGDLSARVPGGESGEEVRHRFTQAMTTIAAVHAGGAVAVVSHVGTLTVGLLSLCTDLTPADVWGHPLPGATPLTVMHADTTWRCGPWPPTTL
jgi:broad specificity phosphatase PhoE